MQEKLTDILCTTNAGNTISIELLPNKPVDLNKLKQLQPQFCSVTWHEDPANLKPENIASIKLCKQLQQNGYHTLLHLAVRNFTKEKALEVLNYLKQTGIRNLLIVQGGASLVLLEKFYNFENFKCLIINTDRRNISCTYKSTL